MGFKFYRDSMRFIAFLACVAGVGFLASAFQFVKLGVSKKSRLPINPQALTLLISG